MWIRWIPAMTEARRLTAPLVAMVTAALCGSLTGCYTVRSRASVVGVYELHAGRQKITLELRPNGVFSELIESGPGVVEKRTGKWNWSAGRLGMEDLWIPKAFAPDYILRADSEAGAGQPRYTEPGYWSVSTESHWGTIVLEIFPDGDVSFRKVRDLRP
jgi:hypothetical protein